MAPAGMFDFVMLKYFIMFFLAVGAVLAFFLLIIIIRWFFPPFNPEETTKHGEELKKCPHCASSIKKECYFCEHYGKQVEND